MLLTVLKPDAKRDVITNRFQLRDYVSVYHLRLHGTWTIQDLLPMAQQAKLACWTNNEEKRASHERSRRKHARG